MAKKEDGQPVGLVKADPRGIVTTSELKSMEWFDPSVQSDPEERMIPYIRLMQGLSNEVREQTAKIGDMLVSTGVNLGKRAVIVPLWLQRQAVLYNEDGVECRSHDGVRGDTHGECARCPYYYRDWKTDPATGKRMPPKCSAILTFPSLVIEADGMNEGEDPGVVAFQFARSSFPVAKQFVTQHDLKGLPYYAHRWEVTSRGKKFKKGEAAVFAARFLGQNPVELMQEAQAACKGWATATVELDERRGEFEEETVATADSILAPKELPF